VRRAILERNSCAPSSGRSFCASAVNLERNPRSFTTGTADALPAVMPSGKKSTTVSEYMTRSPASIGAEQPLSVAHDLMRKKRIRHLPVLHGGKLVGIVSLRDLHLVETLEGVTPDRVSVEEAMSPDVYCVTSDAPLKGVVREMARRKLGSAIVTRGTKVVGVFTTVDALRALDQALA
jgi:acetoin utilization protein AcuB